MVFFSTLLRLVATSQPPGKVSAHVAEIFAVGVKFFRRAGDVAALAALGVGMLGAAFEERGVAFGEFAEDDDHGVLGVVVRVAPLPRRMSLPAASEAAAVRDAATTDVALSCARAWSAGGSDSRLRFDDDGSCPSPTRNSATSSASGANAGFRFDGAREESPREVRRPFRRVRATLRGWRRGPGSGGCGCGILFGRCRGLRRMTTLFIGEIAAQDVGSLGGWAFEEVELVDAAIFVAALFCRQVEAPGAAIGQDDEGNAGVEGVFEGLADGILGLARAV